MVPPILAEDQRSIGRQLVVDPPSDPPIIHEEEEDDRGHRRRKWIPKLRTILWGTAMILALTITCITMVRRFQRHKTTKDSATARSLGFALDGSPDVPLSMADLRSTLRENLQSADIMRNLLHQLDSKAPSELLIIPFYLIDDPDMNALLEECFTAHSTLSNFQGSGDGMAELLIIQLMRHHPWRVMDPADALVHVIPWPLGTVFNEECGSMDRMEQFAQRVIARPEWKRNHGNDHLYISTHYACHNMFREYELHNKHKQWAAVIQILTSSTWGTYINWERKPFCMITVPFWSPDQTDELLQEPVPSIEEYLASRPYDTFFLGRFFSDHHAGGYTTRRALWTYMQNREPGHNDVVISSDDIVNSRVAQQYYGPNKPYMNCSSGESDERLDLAQRACFEPHSSELYKQLSGEAKYHLHVRGDDWSSRRLFESLASGSLVLTLSDGLLDRGLPFQCEIDWENVLIEIGEIQFRNDPSGSWSKFVPKFKVAEERADLQVRLESIYAARQQLWYTPNSKLVENILTSTVRSCFPEAYLRRWNGSGPRSLRALKCPFAPVYNKVIFSPRECRPGSKQAGWCADD